MGTHPWQRVHKLQRWTFINLSWKWLLDFFNPSSRLRTKCHSCALSYLKQAWLNINRERRRLTSSTAARDSFWARSRRKYQIFWQTLQRNTRRWVVKAAVRPVWGFGKPGKIPQYFCWLYHSFSCGHSRSWKSCRKYQMRNIWHLRSATSIMTLMNFTKTSSHGKLSSSTVWRLVVPHSFISQAHM